MQDDCSSNNCARVCVPVFACSRGMWHGPRRTPRTATGSEEWIRLAGPAPEARSKARTEVDKNILAWLSTIKFSGNVLKSPFVCPWPSWSSCIFCISPWISLSWKARGKKFVSVILTRGKRIWLTLQICRGPPRTDMNSKWAVYERIDTSYKCTISGWLILNSY